MRSGDPVLQEDRTAARIEHAVDRRVWLLRSLGLLAVPLVSRAQPQSKVYRIGLLGGSSRTSPESAHVWEGLFQGLRVLGYIEGQNISVEGRFYGKEIERLPALASELVKLRVDVIVVGATPAPEAARRATSTTPIVMFNHTDPVGSQLVSSLAKPGGNVTGISLNMLTLRGKQLQLLKEAVPTLASVAVLANPDIPFHELDMHALETAARPMKIQLYAVDARAPGEFAEAFSMAKKRRAGALFVLSGVVFFAHRSELVELVAKSRLPAISGWREFADAGGLMSYGPDLRDSARQAAKYVGKILKGANPGDLPIEEPSKFELVINLKAAKALGLTIPRSILARADQIIE